MFGRARPLVAAAAAAAASSVAAGVAGASSAPWDPDGSGRCASRLSASTTGHGTWDAMFSPGGMPYSLRGIHSARKAPPRAASEMGLFIGAASMAMIGLAYASVPLYRMFCAATGYGGTARTGQSVEEKLRARMDKPDAKLEEAAANREITIWFNADVSNTMPWTFTPTQECVRVKPGQSTLAFFTAKNLSDKPVTGFSVYNVTPDKVAFYFNKIQCFCFEEQRLRPKEEIDMPVFFYLDPEIATDWNCRNIDDITLSYTFHRVEDDDLDEEDDYDITLPSQVKLHGSLPPGVYPGMPDAVAASARGAPLSNSRSSNSSSPGASAASSQVSVTSSADGSGSGPGVGQTGGKSVVLSGQAALSAAAAAGGTLVQAGVAQVK